MAISTNGTVLTRLAGALYNTQMSNATYSEVKALDPATLANALYARDFANATDLVVATTLVTNLGLASVAGLDNWVAAQLTAAGSAKGAKIVDLLNGFAQMSSDATYGAAATAFNTKVDAALVLSQTTGYAGASFGSAAPAPEGATFSLTTNTDVFTSNNATVANKTTAGNDLFRSTATGQLNDADVIDGGAGDDTLTATLTEAQASNVAAAISVKPALTSVESITFTSLDSGASSTNGENDVKLDLGDSTGVLSVTVVAGDDVDSVVAGVTTAVALTYKTGGTTADFTATYKGLSTATDGGSDSATISLSTGDFAVATVAGVETLTLNAIDGSSDIDTLTAAALEKLVITGNKSIDIGSATAVAFSGLDTGETAVLDASAASGDAVVVAIGQLAKINATGGAGKLTTISNTALSAAGANTVTVSAGTGALSADIALVTNTSSATATNLATITGSAGADTLDIQDVATATDLTATAEDEAKNVTAIVNAGEGNDTIKINTGVVTVNAGAGDDRVEITAAAQITANDSIEGGEGTDTLVFASAEVDDAAGLSAAIRAKLTGFEKVAISDAFVDLFDASKFAVNTITFEAGLSTSAAKANDGVSGLTSGATLTFGSSAAVTSSASNAGDIAVTITGSTAAGANSDMLNLVFASDIDIASTGTDVVLEISDSLGIVGVDTVNITASDAKADADGVADSQSDDGYKITFANDGALDKIVVSGSSKVQAIISSSAVTLAEFDGTASTGELVFDASAATTLNAVSIKGGSAGDTLTGGALADLIEGNGGADTLAGGTGDDIINAGAGNDSVTGGTGAETISLGGGVDTVVIYNDLTTGSAYNDSTATAYDKVSGFDLATKSWTGSSANDAVSEYVALAIGGTETDVLDLGVEIADGTATTVPVVKSAVAAGTASAASTANVTYSVTSGILTLAGTGAAAVDTLAEWVTEAAAVVAGTVGTTVAFEFGGNTYVYIDNTTTSDSMVELTGLVGVKGISALAGSGTVGGDGFIILG